MQCYSRLYVRACLLHLHCAVGWGIHNKELDDFYASSNIRAIISPRMKWVWDVAHNGEKRNAFRFGGGWGGGRLKALFWFENEYQRIYGMYLSGEWWRPIVGSCKHLYNFFVNKNVNFLTSCATVGLWRWILLHGISTKLPDRSCVVPCHTDVKGQCPLLSFLWHSPAIYKCILQCLIYYLTEVKAVTSARIMYSSWSCLFYLFHSGSFVFRSHCLPRTEAPNLFSLRLEFLFWQSQVGGCLTCLWVNSL